MNIENISNKLQKSGLSKNEANLYILLFKIGTQSASILARKLDIPRTTAGFYCESLYKKGLLSKSKKANMFLYSISSSDALILFLENQKKIEILRLNEQIKNAQDILPELQSFEGTSPTRPKVTFYEGVEGLRTVYNDTLTSSETLRSLAQPLRYGAVLFPLPVLNTLNKKSKPSINLGGIIILELISEKRIIYVLIYLLRFRLSCLKKISE